MATATEMGTGDTLPSAFFSQVAASREQTALRRKTLGLWEEVTWAGYEKGVRSVAAALISAGVEPGEAVGLISENRVEWLFGDLGILAAGAVTCAMYTTSSADQIQYIASHSGQKLVIVENEEQLDKILTVRKSHNIERIVVIDSKGLRNLGEPGVEIWDDFVAGGAALLAEQPTLLDDRLSGIDPNDLAILVYTSGTTGPPKGVMLSHRSVLWTCGTLAKVGRFEKGDDVLSFLPLCHVAERILTVFYQVVHGTVVNFAENLDTIQQNLTEVRPLFFFAVPRVWEKFHSSIEIRMRDATLVKRTAYRWALDVGHQMNRHRQSSYGKTDEAPPASLALRFKHALAEQTILRPLREKLGLDRARFAASGAAPISPEVIGYFQALGIPLVEAYGQTESGALITANQPGFPPPGLVGRPVDGLEMRLADDGEIQAKSPGVMLGYYRDEGATAATVSDDGWLSTGDVGEIDEDGFLRITDRKKDLIITAGGKNIAPQYVENKLRVSPYINDAIVIGDRRKFVSALIILDEDNLVQWAQKNRAQFGTYSELARSKEVLDLIKAEIDSVNSSLTHVEAVKQFRVLERRLDRDEGELTPTLKVRRKIIAEKYGSLIEEMYS